MCPQPAHDLDLLVLGAGSGGLAAARRAAALGAHVAVVEANRVGGTCVTRGCIPKKLMVHAAGLGRARALAADYGWAAAPGGAVDWPTLVRLRNRVVNNLELAHTRHLAEAGVTLVHGRAVLTGPHTAEVDGVAWRAGAILIATGGEPVLPRFGGSDAHACDSDGFFDLAAMPARALVVGGGYIAVEFACLLAGLGAQVSLVVRSTLLRGFDQDLQEGMLAGMRAAGIAVHLGAQVERVEAVPGGRAVRAVRAHLVGEAAGQPVEVDHCLVTAVGRRPRTAGLGAEAAGVALDDHGAVVVDAAHRTSVASIYAVGDVIDRVNLTPMAIRAGRTVAAQLFGDGAAAVDYTLTPTAVFGHPQLGTVGLTEAEARARPGAQIRVHRSRYVPLVYAPAAAERKVTSTMKLVVDGESDRVLGVHALGDDAAEIVQGFAAALVAGVTKAQLDATLAVHPTQAEELVLMR